MPSEIFTDTRSGGHVAAWTRDALAQATGGTWLIAPAENWRASGLCAYQEGFRPGHVLLSRGNGNVKGLAPKWVRAFAPRASAIICVDPAPWQELGLPLLQVPDSFEALLAVAGAMRRLFAGKVLAVTGSSGKTTTTHLAAHVLRAFGPLSHSLGSANMLFGVAWNAASMSLDDAYWILELSLAKMQRTSRLVAPDAAIVLNVSEAHLIYWNTVENIARQKSAVFLGMQPGSVAVVNHDMDMFPIFEEAARKRELRLLTFGKARDADLRLLEYNAGGMRFAYRDAVFSAALPLPGEHIAMDCLAVLGAAAAFGLSLEKALMRLPAFTPVEGRGARREVLWEGKRLKIIDESYNANPASMRAALAAFSEESCPDTSRVLMLGDMLELGEDAPRYHYELEQVVRLARPDRILLVGPEMRHLWEKLENAFSGGAWYPDVNALLQDCPRWLKDQDTVLIKSSNGTGLTKLVALLCGMIA